MEEPDLVKTQGKNTDLVQLIEENGEKKIFVAQTKSIIKEI